MTASQGELEVFGLPPRPPPSATLLCDAFAAMFSGLPEFVDAGAVPAVSSPLPRPRSTGAIATTTTYRSPYELSRNWSGAYIEAHNGKMFVQVTALWTVPTLRPPPIRLSPSPSSGVEYHASAWVGLDGQRQYYGSSLPQIGTVETLPTTGSGQTSAHAFFQWYADGKVAPDLFYLAGVDVQPGDQVGGMVWVPKPDFVHAFFRNFRTNQITIFEKAAPLVRLPDDTEAPAGIAGATAEWVVEQPSKLLSPPDPVDTRPVLLPFPNYGHIKFTHCIGGLAPAPGEPTEGMAMDGTRFIRLLTPLADPDRFVIVSRPRKICDTKLMLEYAPRHD